MSRSPACASCEAPLRWAKTASGKSMPLNAEPDPEKGNVKVDDYGKAIVYGAEVARREREAGASLYLSHHATCPDRGRFTR